MRMRAVSTMVYWAAALASGCDACGPATVVNTRAKPLVTPQPTLDFGQADVTQRKHAVVTVTNNGDRPFNELTWTFTPETDPAFSLPHDPPTAVNAGGTRTVEVTLLPEVATTYSGTLLLRGRVADESAADPKFQDFRVDLRAVAVNNGLPRIEVTPAQVDFGRVGIHDVARATVTIRNTGIRDLIVESASLDAPAGSPFHCASCASLATTLSPTASVTTEIVFSPEGLESYQSSLHVLSLDPNARDVAVPLVGAGSAVPVACLGFVDDMTLLRPQTTVRLDAACSTATIPGTWLAHFLWELTYRTAGSTTTLENVLPQHNGARGLTLDIACPDPAAVGATPCSQRVDTVADLAGTYEVSLTVVDNLGIASAPVSLSYRAIPEEALHIQLVWDHPTADLDLHLMKNSGPPFNRASDCYFGNRFPAWWGNTNDEDPRNPRLDVDDTGGFGPENINVRAPEPMRYRIGVHYWNKKTEGDPATLATVRIYVKGQLALEQVQFFAQDQQFWSVVDMEWPAQQDALPVINPISEVVPFPRPF